MLASYTGMSRHAFSDYFKTVIFMSCFTVNPCTNMLKKISSWLVINGSVEKLLGQLRKNFKILVKFWNEIELRTFKHSHINSLSIYFWIHGAGYPPGLVADVTKTACDFHVRW